MVKKITIPLDDNVEENMPDFLTHCRLSPSSVITGSDSVEYTAGAIFVCSDGYTWIRIGRGNLLSNCLIFKWERFI